MPQAVDLSLRRLASSGSTNALFRLGEGLLVRLPPSTRRIRGDLEGGQVAAGRGGLVADRRARALRGAEVPSEAMIDPDLRWYRGHPLAALDEMTRQNIAHCRALGDFEFDLDAAEQLWDDAVRLPGARERGTPRWHHADLAAENLLMRHGHLAAVLDFGSLSVGDPTVDLAVAWEVLDPPRERSSAGTSAWTTRPGCGDAPGRSASP